VYSVLKKVPEYRYPLYPSTSIQFKKVVFEPFFTVKSTTLILCGPRSQTKTPTQHSLLINFKTAGYGMHVDDRVVKLADKHVDPGGFGSLVKYPALVHYMGGVTLCGCVFVHKLQGEVTTAQVDTCTVYQTKYPSTGIPCTTVRVFGLKKLF
jgi:hypothetical protein